MYQNYERFILLSSQVFPIFVRRLSPERPPRRFCKVVFYRSKSVKKRICSSVTVLHATLVSAAFGHLLFNLTKTGFWRQFSKAFTQEIHIHSGFFTHLLSQSEIGHFQIFHEFISIIVNSNKF